MVTWVDLTADGYDVQRARNFQDALSDRLQSMPGVESVAFARVMPFTNTGYSSAPIAVDGYVRAPEEDPTVDYDEVGPGYLATMGIPLAAGREYANLAPGELITMQEQVDRTTAVQRVLVIMLAAFAGLALLLAALGLYGVMSYTVSQSSRDFALRMALDASTSNVLKLVLSRGLALTAGARAASTDPVNALRQ